MLAVLSPEHATCYEMEFISLMMRCFVFGSYGRSCYITRANRPTPRGTFRCQTTQLRDAERFAVCPPLIYFSRCKKKARRPAIKLHNSEKVFIKCGWLHLRESCQGQVLYVPHQMFPS
ncbi:uncharacterized protein LAJ45_01498 [Morchella importuna]|uniref:uncharacterized protein n=1 Tax=Morchella importuna TaxID=1174673 RepID=UPI001E8E6E49|nr:uncharacterized protein LAJ45_01498 [Morchella importuna]KAH8154965.1 hypothetical protein LAJ45_01498 [Morchella importuna]